MGRDESPLGDFDRVAVANTLHHSPFARPLGSLTNLNALTDSLMDSSIGRTKAEYKTLAKKHSFGLPVKFISNAVPVRVEHIKVKKYLF